MKKLHNLYHYFYFDFEVIVVSVVPTSLKRGLSSSDKGVGIPSILLEQCYIIYLLSGHFWRSFV